MTLFFIKYSSIQSEVEARSLLTEGTCVWHWSSVLEIFGQSSTFNFAWSLSRQAGLGQRMVCRLHLYLIRKSSKTPILPGFSSLQASQPPEIQNGCTQFRWRPWSTFQPLQRRKTSFWLIKSNCYKPSVTWKWARRDYCGLVKGGWRYLLAIICTVRFHNGNLWGRGMATLTRHLADSHTKTKGAPQEATGILKEPPADQRSSKTKVQEKFSFNWCELHLKCQLVI